MLLYFSKDVDVAGVSEDNISDWTHTLGITVRQGGNGRQEVHHLVDLDQKTPKMRSIPATACVATVSTTRMSLRAKLSITAQAECVNQNMNMYYWWKQNLK